MALKAITIFGLLTVGVWLNNTSSSIELPEIGRVNKLVAHHGQKADGQQFIKVLADQRYHSTMFGVYGGKKSTRTATKQLGDIKGFDQPALRACGLSHFAIGRTGLVRNACKNKIIAMPINYGELLWGWPQGFTSRMKTVNTDVIVLGPYDGTGFSSGIDKGERLSRVSNKFDGYIWTNNIEVVGPLFTSNVRF